MLEWFECPEASKLNIPLVNLKPWQPVFRMIYRKTTIIAK
jgi:hypothetical protein